MITVASIRVDSISVTCSNEPSMEGSYSLLSENGRVIAKQSTGGYQGIKLMPSPETAKALSDFIASYRKDIATLIGL